MIPVEIALVTLWALLFIRNKAAILPLFVLLIDIFVINDLKNGMVRYCVVAAVCFALAATNKTPNYLRAPLLAAGSAYWVGALDELLYTYLSVTTVYYDFMPYLIITINAYIAAVLFDKGGGQLVGFDRRFGRLANRGNTWL